MNGSNGEPHKEVTSSREQELQISVEDLRRELQEKAERMKLLVEENKAHRQEILDMTEQAEEHENAIRRLKQEMEEEHKSWEFAGEEKEKLALAVERIRELETQLQLQASSVATETRTRSITVAAEEQLAKLEDAVNTKSKELDSLSSSLVTLERTNRSLQERVEELDLIRSQIQSALDQAQSQAERFKRESDVQLPLSFLVLFFSIFFICIAMGLVRLYDVVLALLPQPTRTYISC